MDLLSIDWMNTHFAGIASADFANIFFLDEIRRYPTTDCTKIFTS